MVKVCWQGLKIVFKGRWLTCLTDTKPGYVIRYHLHIYVKKDAELQSKHNLILHVKQLTVFLKKYGYTQKHHT